MQIFNFRDSHVATFRHPSNGTQMPAPQTQKAHLQSLGFPSVSFNWFEVKLFPVGCAQDSRMALKTRKNAVLDLAPPTL